MLNWLFASQVIEPSDKDKGKYSIIITDPENSHKRTLDLSGDGQYTLSFFLSQCQLSIMLVKWELETTQPLFFFNGARSLVFHEGCGMLPLFISLRGCRAYWGQIQLYSWAKARVHPEWVASSLQDPYWWQWLPHRVPTAHQEQFWGSVSCSRILRHVAQSHPRGTWD